jgi:hypothetical protein
MSPEVLESWFDIARDPNEKTADRIQAGALIVSYGHGKPPQAISAAISDHREPIMKTVDGTEAADIYASMIGASNSAYDDDHVIDVAPALPPVPTSVEERVAAGEVMVARLSSWSRKKRPKPSPRVRACADRGDGRGRAVATKLRMVKRVLRAIHKRL